MSRISRLLTTLLLLAATQMLTAAEPFVVFQPQTDALQLNDGRRITIFVDAADERGVRLAAANVLADLRTVCGADTAFTSSAAETTPLSNKTAKWFTRKSSKPCSRLTQALLRH